MHAGNDKSLSIKDLSPAPWLNAALAKLEGLRALPANWDSYDALPVGLESIAWAKEILAQLATYAGVDAPTVTATPDGHVGLCWDMGRWSLDASIDSAGVIGFVFLDEDASDENREARTCDPRDLVPFLTLPARKGVPMRPE